MGSHIKSTNRVVTPKQAQPIKGLHMDHGLMKIKSQPLIEIQGWKLKDPFTHLEDPFNISNL